MDVHRHQINYAFLVPVNLPIKFKKYHRCLVTFTPSVRKLIFARGKSNTITTIQNTTSEGNSKTIKWIFSISKEKIIISPMNFLNTYYFINGIIFDKCANICIDILFQQLQISITVSKLLVANSNSRIK